MVEFNAWSSGAKTQSLFRLNSISEWHLVNRNTVSIHPDSLKILHRVCNFLNLKTCIRTSVIKPRKKCTRMIARCLETEIKNLLQIVFSHWPRFFPLWKIRILFLLNKSAKRKCCLLNIMKIIYNLRDIKST